MIDFDKLIEKYLHSEPWPKTPGRYYPSEIGGCMRKVWYSYKHPVTPDGDLRKIFHMGNIIHNFVVDVLMSEKTPEVRLVESELPVKIMMGDITISGRIDDLMHVKAEGKDYLVEVKSTKWLEATKEPSPVHVMQLQLYMHGQGIHNGILLYIEKNTLKTKSFEIAYDAGQASTALERFRKLHGHVKGNTLPAPEAKQQDSIKWQCSYCDYKDRCDNAEGSQTENG